MIKNDASSLDQSHFNKKKKNMCLVFDWQYLALHLTPSAPSPRHVWFYSKSTAGHRLEVYKCMVEKCVFYEKSR